MACANKLTYRRSGPTEGTPPLCGVATTACTMRVVVARPHTVVASLHTVVASPHTIVAIPNPVVASAHAVVANPHRDVAPSVGPYISNIVLFPFLGLFISPY